MSNRTNLTWLVLLLAMAMSFASCHKNEAEPNSDNPGSGGGSDPVVPIVPGDPEGTVTINMNNSAVDNYNWYDIGIGSPIRIDDANNFGSSYNEVSFVSIGEVEALGHVTTIPTEGWSSTVAVIPGNGYLVRHEGLFARLYVVDYIINTQGGIMGATIKYQSPFLFNEPISLETSSLSFGSDGGIQTVRLTSLASFSIEEKPEWCTVSVDLNTITVSVMGSSLHQPRFDDIVLKNNVSTIRLSIEQEGFCAQLPYYQGFEDSFGTYITYDVRGPQSWEIDYSTAKMTGYANSTNYENEDWLISSPVAITGVRDAKMTMVYIGRYFNNINEEVTIWASSDYIYGNNPTTATWIQVPAVLLEGNNWSDFKTSEIALTQWVGQNVTLAVKYTSTNDKAGTLEIQSITIEGN